MRATTIVGSTTFRCGFTSGLSSALIALEMQIRSPSVPCGGGGVDKHREMQKISTALAEDPFQGGSAAAPRLGLAGRAARARLWLAQCAVCGKASNARGRVRVTQTPGFGRFGLV